MAILERKNHSILGIDLATRKIGIYVKNDMKQSYGKVLTLKKFNKENMYSNLCRLNVIFHNIRRLYGPDLVVIELSNYSLKTAQMFSFYAGIIYPIFIDSKFVEPREWQSLMLKEMNIEIIYKPTLVSGKTKRKIPQKFYVVDGEEFKATSGVIKDFSKRFYYLKNGEKEEDDNITDAFAIAYFGAQCKGIW